MPAAERAFRCNRGVLGRAIGVENTHAPGLLDAPPGFCGQYFRAGRHDAQPEMEAPGRLFPGQLPQRRRVAGQRRGLPLVQLFHHRFDGFAGVEVPRRPVLPDVDSTTYCPRKSSRPTRSRRWTSASASRTARSVISWSNDSIMAALVRIGSSASGRFSRPLWNCR